MFIIISVIRYKRTVLTLKCIEQKSPGDKWSCYNVFSPGGLGENLRSWLCRAPDYTSEKQSWDFGWTATNKKVQDQMSLISLTQSNGSPPLTLSLFEISKFHICFIFHILLAPKDLGGYLLFCNKLIGYKTTKNIFI